MRSLVEVSRLAVRDFASEWRFSILGVMALVSALAPLMILFGLRTGYVEGEREEILNDPKGLGLFPGNVDGRYDDAWIAEMASRDEVRFVAPKLSFLSARITMQDPEAARDEVPVQLVPTGDGDPMLRGAAVPAGYGEAALSATAARRLGVGVGDEATAVVRGLASRKRGELDRVKRVPLRVVAIVPEAREEDAVAFVSLELLLATEDWKANHPVPALGWPGIRPAPDTRRYSGFRLYASTIYDVLPLRDELEASGYAIESNADRIADLQRVHGTLDRVAWLVASVAGAGAALGIAASFWGSVERKRHQLSVLRLLGFTRRSTVLFPMVQGGALALVGVAASFALFAAGAGLLNRVLDVGRLRCLLHADHYLAFAGVALGGVLLASALAAIRVSRIEPAEGLRHVS